MKVVRVMGFRSYLRLAVTALLLALSLGGCGFQLRGSELGRLSAVGITGVTVAPATYKTLRDELESYGLDTGAPEPGALEVRLLDERTRRRSVATTDVIDTAAWELRLELDVSITRGDRALVADTTLVSERVYEVDSANLSGSFEEQSRVLADMRSELVKQLVERLEAAARRDQDAAP